MALDMPAHYQPVAVDMGSRKTAGENIAPMATQVMSAPHPRLSGDKEGSYPMLHHDGFGSPQRSDRKHLRSSCVNKTGCSKAAK